MPRPLNEIVAHLRACIADGSIKATFIQTEDLSALCDAAEENEQLRALLSTETDRKGVDNG